MRDIQFKFPNTAGIVLVERNMLPSKRSHDVVNPSGSFLSSDVAQKYEWNPFGNGLLLEKFGFAIVYLNDSGLESLLIERANYNAAQSGRKFKPFQAEFTFIMNSLTDSTSSSKSCLKEGTCLPIGGHSVWSVMAPRIRNAPIVLGSTEIDSWSLFPLDMSVGTRSSSSGLVTLLATAHAISQINESILEQLPKQIMLAFFQAESFGYAGSRNFLKDVESFSCTKVSNFLLCHAKFRFSHQGKDVSCLLSDPT